MCLCASALLWFIASIYVHRKCNVLNFVRDTRSFTTKLSSSQRTEYKGQPALYRFIQWKIHEMWQPFLQTHCHLFGFSLPNRIAERCDCVCASVRVCRLCTYVCACECVRAYTLKYARSTPLLLHNIYDTILRYETTSLPSYILYCLVFDSIDSLL